MTLAIRPDQNAKIFPSNPVDQIGEDDVSIIVQKAI